MWRFLLVGVACVPLVLWGLKGVGASPHARERPEPPPAVAALATDDGAEEALALWKPEGEEPARDDVALRAAARRFRNALDEADRFAVAKARPFGPGGQLDEKRTRFANENLKKAWDDFVGKAKSAQKEWDELAKARWRADFKSEVEGWLKELPRKWGKWPGRGLDAAEEASAALARFAERHGESHLKPKASEEEKGWAKVRQAMGRMDAASAALERAADEKDRQERRRDMLSGLADVIDFADPAEGRDAAKTAAGTLCTRLLPSPMPLDATVIVEQRSGPVSVKRDSLKVWWKGQADAEGLSDGTKGGLTEFAVRASHDRVDEFTWEGGKYNSERGAKLEATLASKMAAEYNRAVGTVKGGRWTKQALKKAYDALATDAVRAKYFAGEGDEKARQQQASRIEEVRKRGHFADVWATLEALHERKGGPGRLFDDE